MNENNERKRGPLQNQRPTVIGPRSEGSSKKKRIVLFFVSNESVPKTVIFQLHIRVSGVGQKIDVTAVTQVSEIYRNTTNRSGKRVTRFTPAHQMSRAREYLALFTAASHRHLDQRSPLKDEN